MGEHRKFRKRRHAPERLTETTPYKECVDFYSNRAGLSETKLALCTRENQQRLNKIARGQLKNVDVETLVRICLILRLTEEEAVDLMSRRERAFSPAKPVHRTYRELIRIYSQKEIDYTVSNEELGRILDEADAYLVERSFLPFEAKNCGQ